MPETDNFQVFKYKIDVLAVCIPGWNCLNFLHVFVGYQANFP